MKLPVPICKKVIHVHSSELDVGQKEDKAIKHRMENLDKLIYGNLNRMVPNVSNSLLNTSLNELTSYVNLCKMYGESINRIFQEKCNDELEKLNKFRSVIERRKEFKIENMNELPEEIVNEIYSYLPYEEKMSDLLYKYSDWKKKLVERNTGDRLKIIYERIHKKHFEFWSFNEEIKRNGLMTYDITEYIRLPDWMRRKRGVYRKTDVVEYIGMFIEKYKNLRKPITRKDEKIYKWLMNRYYKLVIDLIYILNKEVPKKKRKVVKRSSGVNKKE
jgi:DNA-binding HxlR family transcriptional regulator